MREEEAEGGVVMRYEDAPKSVQAAYRKEVARKPSRLPGKKGPPMSEVKLAEQLALSGIGGYERDLKILPGRKVEADFTFERLIDWRDRETTETSWLAVFLDGRAHIFEKADGNNGSGGKRSNDCERQNLMPLLLPRWTVFYFTPAQVGQLVALDAIKAWLENDEPGMLAALQRKAGRE